MRRQVEKEKKENLRTKIKKNKKEERKGRVKKRNALEFTLDLAFGKYD